MHQGLILSKENGLVIVIPEDVTAQLAKHQIEGLRFLYRQFKKNNPGVILNDPTGYGKKTQVTIFLNAIKSIVSQPILVLCSEIDLPKWKYHFYQWTHDDDDDIMFDSDKPFSNKKIFINLFESIETFCKRSWSIVVVDDPLSLKLFRPLRNVTATFKIWIVSIDLKAHLNTFTAINEWVNPGSKFLRDLFVADSNNVRDVVEKAIQLDCYFEDLVLRRGTSKLGESQPEPIFSPEARVSRKNKDASGTKVKKSKKRFLDNIDDELTIEKSKKKETKHKRKSIEDQNNEIELNNENHRRKSCDDMNIDEENYEVSKMDENFDANSNKNNHNQDDVIEQCSETSQEIVLNYDCSNADSPKHSGEELEANLSRRYNVCSIRNILLNDEISSKVTTSEEKELNNLTTANEINVNITDMHEFDEMQHKTEKVDSSDIQGHTKFLEVEERTMLNRSTINNETRIETECNKVLKVDKSESLNESNNEIDSDFNIAKMSETILTSVFFGDINKTKSKVKLTENVKMVDTEVVKKESVSEIDVTKDASLNVSSNDDSIQSDKEEQSFDDKLKELQNSTNKKFRGSLLDNLF